MLILLDFFVCLFSSHRLDHLPRTLLQFMIRSSILLYFIAMVCVALTRYQFISQLCCLNYCQNNWFMFLLQALENLIIWTETFFLSTQLFFQMVDITLSSPFFSFLKWFSLAMIYFRLLELTSWICILPKFAFWCQWGSSNLNSMMILLHQVNFNSKLSWKNVTFQIIWNCTSKCKALFCCFVVFFFLTCYKSCIH